MNRFLSRSMLVLLSGGILFYVFQSKPPSISSYSREEHPVEMPALLPGDLVFRRCNGLPSQMVDVMDESGEFSHVGLVWLSGEGDAFVIHALPGEEEGEGFVQLTPLWTFVNHPDVQSCAVFRLSPEFAMVAQEAATWAYERVDVVKFDSSFDLATDDALYCTELIWKAYLQAGFDLTGDSFDEWETPIFGKREYIFPSRLLHNAFVVSIFSEDKSK